MTVQSVGSAVDTSIQYTPPPQKWTSNKLVARYLYQILKGCGDSNCKAIFCHDNCQACLLSRKISKTSAGPLACHLASLHGETQLCNPLKVDPLPFSIRKHLDEKQPLKSPILATSIFALTTVENPKSFNGLPAVLFNSRCFMAWPSYSFAPSAMLSYIYQYLYAAIANNDSAKPLRSISHPLLKLLDPYMTISYLFPSDEPMPDLCDGISELIDVREFALGRYVSHALTAARSLAQNSAQLLQRIDTLFGMVCTFSDVVTRSLLHIPLPIKEFDSWDFISYSNPSHSFYYSALSRYGFRWPFQSYYALSLPDMRKIMTVNGRFELGPTSIGLPYAQLIFSTNGYFRRISRLPDVVYMSELQSLLPLMCRLQLFRFGCFRQMSTVVNRVSNHWLAGQRLQGLVGDCIPMARVHVGPRVEGDYLVFDIDRHNVLSSAIEIIPRALMVEDLIRRPLHVRFGAGELAVDQGGVQIEFFQVLGQQMCYSGHGLFKVYQSSRLAFFNPGYDDDPRVYEYLGILFGLAIYNGCTIGILFPSFVYRAIKAMSFEEFKRHPATLDDYKELSPTAARSLKTLLSIKDVSSLNLSFEYTYDSAGTGTIKTMPLPSASEFDNVDNSNVQRYVNEYIHCALRSAVEPQFEAFIKGVRFILCQQILDLVTVTELKTFAEGINEIDVDELRAHTTYIDGFTCTSPTIINFWSVVSEFTQEQKESFLEFVTGSRRVPIGGVKKLEFAIQYNGVDNTRLPSASVCFFRLLLPAYKSKQELKKRLLLAIEHSNGFGLV